MLGCLRAGGSGLEYLQVVGVDAIALERALRLKAPTRPQEDVGDVKLTQLAKSAIDVAYHLEHSLRHGYIGTEHIILGCLKRPSPLLSEVLAEQNIDLHRLPPIEAPSQPGTDNLSHYAKDFGLNAFISAHSIGGTDILNLPVNAIGPAVAFYGKVLGFTCVDREANHAVLQNGTATIGITVNDSDPEQASVYFEITNPTALRTQLLAAGSEPSPIRIDDHGGNKYEVFFDKEPYGVCFCFGRRLT
jgi:catechol 2,3-dioxygenase-like lactoylglutathione lyase family enzyme